MNSSRWKEYLTTLVGAILLALIVRSVFLTAYKVPTGSMQPALKPGDFIFTLRPAYGLKLPFSSRRIGAHLPERGDLVVFSYPNQPQVSYVKRVVALPGDRVEIKGDRMIVNGRRLEYEQLKDVADNPNPDMFDIYSEKDSNHQRAVIFEKEGRGESKNFGPMVVPPGEIFLLGDNRDASDDSRYWGTVPMNQVVGRVLFIWLSLDSQHKWGGDRYPSVRWNRIFTSVH
jgi:signal peptidase I